MFAEDCVDCSAGVRRQSLQSTYHGSELRLLSSKSLVSHTLGVDLGSVHDVCGLWIIACMWMYHVYCLY